MFRNDVVMTPLRVKQAIDSRFVKPSENELNVLIGGTWVEFVKVVDEWYDTLGFTEFIENKIGDVTTWVNTNTVTYTPEEMSDILPIHVKWKGIFTDVETGEVLTNDCMDVYVQFVASSHIYLPHSANYETIIQTDDLPELSHQGVHNFRLRIARKSDIAPDKVLVDGYFEIRDNDANGTILGHYPLRCTLETIKECYLTTAMVGYYGKPDDGIELTAMRRLREVYSEKHAETLKTYYADSAIIVSEIERLGMQDYYYGRIKDVVNAIVIHVENENWGVAEKLYLNLYYGLKEELM